MAEYRPASVNLPALQYSMFLSPDPNVVNKTINDAMDLYISPVSWSTENVTRFNHFPFKVYENFFFFPPPSPSSPFLCPFLVFLPLVLSPLSLFHHGQPAAGSLPLAAHLFVFRRNVNDSDSGCGVWRWNLLKRDRAVTDCESAQTPVSVGVSGWHHSPPRVHRGDESPWLGGSLGSLTHTFFFFCLQTLCAVVQLLLFHLLSLNIKWEANWGSFHQAANTSIFCQLLSFIPSHNIDQAPLHLMGLCGFIPAAG